MAKNRRHLGEILYKAGLVKREALINAIKTSKANKKRLGQVLLELGLIDDMAFARFWRESRDMHRPQGRWALRQELRRKGIEAEGSAATLGSGSARP